MAEQPPTKVPRVDGSAVKRAIKVLSSGQPLQADDARGSMTEIMSGQATQAQIGAFLALLTLDKCTAEILYTLADVMRSEAMPVDLPRSNKHFVCDVVGTGGDGQNTFNISTGAGLVAAGAGCTVAKHGNRAVTSASGSSDVLEKLGARLDVTGPDVPAVLAAGGFVFLNARVFHTAMKHVGPARQELGIRTVFNVLGPLTNPAKPDGIVCGVFAESLGRVFIEVFKKFGMRKAMVVHGCEGLDEISVAGQSLVWELQEDGNIREYSVEPADFGVSAQPLTSVASGSPEENAAEMRQLLAGDAPRKAVEDMVCMNAGAVLYVSGKAADLKAGTELARAALAKDKAFAAMERYVEATAPKE